MPDSQAEAGITLVEIMVSLMILGVVLTAFFQVLTGNLQSLSDSRVRQEISQIATEVLEEARNSEVRHVAMVDDFDDSTIVGGCASGQVDVFGDGTCEELAKTPDGQIDGNSPWVGTSGAIEYRTFVTLTGPDPKDPVRVTVVAEYELTRGPEIIRRSTLISEAGRA